MDLLYFLQLFYLSPHANLSPSCAFEKPAYMLAADTFIPCFIEYN
jgi:hypothetical protein